MVWSSMRLRPPRFGRVPAAQAAPRRDLRRTTEMASANARAAAHRAMPALGEPALTVEYAFTRAELQPVLQAIRDTLGCGALPLDSPARLQEALATLIRSVGGCGDPTVRRSPAALLTPEYWQIRLDETDTHTLDVLVDVVGRRTAR